MFLEQDNDAVEIDQVYEAGLEDVPCISSGWETRVSKKTFIIGSREIDLKLVHPNDIISSMIEMWVSGRHKKIQSLHVKKIARQIIFIIETLQWASSQSDDKLFENTKDNLRALERWVSNSQFEVAANRDTLLNIIKRNIKS